MRLVHCDDQLDWLGLVAAVFVHAQRIPPIAHIVALVTVVLDLEVLRLHVIDDVVAVLTGIATLQTRVLASGIVAFHTQRDDLTQFSLVRVVEHQPNFTKIKIRIRILLITKYIYFILML